LKADEQRDRFLVSEMLHHAEILDVIARKGKEALGSDPLVRYAAEHATELFAEAAEKVSNAFKGLNPRVPWDRLRPLRRTVAHPYDLPVEMVNINELWAFVNSEAPRISRFLRNAKFPRYEEASPRG